MNPGQEIEKVFRLKEPQKKALKRLKLNTLSDLLFHFPARHRANASIIPIANVKPGENVTVSGKIVKQETKKAWRRKIPMAEMTIEDQSGKIKAVWFHQAYMAKKFAEGMFVEMSGVTQEKNGKAYFANPDLEASAGQALFENTPENAFAGVYPESRGISSLWFRFTIDKILKDGVHKKLKDPIPENILKKYNLPSLSTALIWIHAPKKEKDALSARKRFSFEEIFLIQLNRLKSRNAYKESPSFKIKIEDKDLDKFIERFPFTPTKAQSKAIKDITKDLKKGEPMTRLLEGDVGSGKTAVAASTAYGVTVTRPEGQDFGRLQTAIMAPTEILAKQHFESFIEYFKHMPIQIGLLASGECRKFPSKVSPEGHTHISKSKLLKWVANGEIPILIGTHALIQKSVEFKHLAYVIIDEQHRFGTNQRATLTQKDKTVPHLLSMTATPIPRTLALTIYGDLDLTLLDEMPKGRKPIETEVVAPSGRKRVYEHIRKELENGRQVYVICPRIDEPDPKKAGALQAKSATREAQRLQEEIFPNYEVGLVHSKLKPKDKDAVMNDFSLGKINILVATSVVEVGVNVPNATVIIIEGAERFGLAQLHQLRGRVLRSNHQAYCYLFSETKAKQSIERLKALVSTKNGFELAERDLELRGPGELAGRKQWGISDIGMEAIKNIKMVEAARNEAQEIIAKDPELENYPDINKKLLEKERLTHFE